MTMTTALICLALNVYHEARGEPMIAQLAVVQVAMNRAKHDPKKACAVVTKPYQFSWTIGKLERRKGKIYVTKQGLPRDKRAWGKALAVTRLVLAGLTMDVVHGATFYHEKSIKPRWVKGMRLVVAHGSHYFYKLV